MDVVTSDAVLLRRLAAGAVDRAPGAIRYNTDMRTAAYIVAINRVATVTWVRAMYA